MSIPPFPMGGSGAAGGGSTAATNLLTGDNATFASTTGAWAATGNATITRTTPSEGGFPAPYPDSTNPGITMKVTTPGGGTSGANGVQLNVAPSDGFKAGRTYTLMLFVAAESAPPENWLVKIVPPSGAESPTVGIYKLGVAYGTTPPYKWWGKAVPWTPTANVTNATIKIYRQGNLAGAHNLHILGDKWGGPRLIEGQGAVTLLPHPDLPDGYYTPMADAFGIVGPQIGSTARDAPVFSLDEDTLYLDGTDAGPDGPGQLYLPSIPGQVSIYAPGSTATQADLQDDGFNLEVGTDYVGVMASQGPGTYPNLTMQFYADWNQGYMMQLRHRGAGRGWATSDDGVTNVRIDDYFQWERTVAGALSVGTNVAAYFETPQKAYIDEVRIRAATRATGADLIVDVNANGTSIFTTSGNRPTVASSITNLTSGGDSTDNTNYYTASVTLKKGRLYLLSVENSHATAAPNMVSAQATINGAGNLMMTSRSTTTYNGGLNRVSIWSGVALNDYTGTIALIYGSTQSGVAWSFDEVIGVDTLTNDGVVQQATGSGSSTTPLATLGAFAQTYNPAYAAHGHAAATSTAPGSGWTELADTDTTVATPAQALQTQYRLDSDTTADATITSAAWGSCAIELAASNSGTSGTPDGGTAVEKNSVITVDVDQVGSTVAGSDLTVFIRGRYIW